MNTRLQALQIGTDIGGTFTDFVALDAATGQVWLEKTLTTPSEPSQGVMNGLDSLGTTHGVPVQDCVTFVHGTTLVINALIERKGEKTGLITTAGFRDVLELRNGLRYDVYDLQLEFPQPLVPRYLRYEISERTLADGTVSVSPDIEQLQAIVQAFRDEGVRSIAVCLLNAHANDTNERAVEQQLSKIAPDITVSLSSEILPQIREYERTSTTTANAYVKPVVRAYLDRLTDGLEQRGFDGSFFVMQSGGGVVGKESARQHPIRMLESGPAAGVAAAKWWARRSNEQDLLCFDMGGTTAKLCTVIDGEAMVTDEYEAARLHHFKRGSGLAINVPVLDLLEIGTGGGSIGHIDKLGLLSVGPQSAGAAPGPACYGRGGDRPTVTDADVVLGFLDPANFLGGTLMLDVEAAEKAIDQHVGHRLAMTTQDAAYRIHDLANEDMAAAARLHLAERGESANKLTMVAYGGAGPVHAYGLAQKLGIRKLIVPPGAGVMSAFGMLVEELAASQVRSYRKSLDSLDLEAIQRLFRKMEEDICGVLGANEDEIAAKASIDLRYRGQGYNVSVAFPTEVPDEAMEAYLRNEFAIAYKTRYGRIYEDVPIDIQNLRLTVQRHRTDAEFEPPAVASSGEPARPVRYRSAYFGPSIGHLDCAVYARDELVPGHIHEGPAFIEERETTVVVGPHGAFEANAQGSLIITVT